MSIAIVTGSAGLVGSEASRHFAKLGMDVIGIDNDMRKVFFGAEASTLWNRKNLQAELGRHYTHVEADVRDLYAISPLWKKLKNNVSLVIHTAAQPSHDWAANDPHMDFSINANGTLNVLELSRQHCPNAPFIFTSTNKVYGDTPNRLPLIEQHRRFEIDSTHTYAGGIREDMPIDQTMHSLFGASKVAADILVQEYGRYFGMPTVCFRGGCITGPGHSAASLHGFLAYLMKCAGTGSEYIVNGFKGKQVRDNIHSADLVNAFDAFRRAPRLAEVYNIGGGRHSNCSILEAIALCEEITGQPMKVTYADANRMGDHVWWVSDIARFRSHFPEWKLNYDVQSILREIYALNYER